jgi:hypothetical protein
VLDDLERRVEHTMAFIAGIDIAEGQALKLGTVQGEVVPTTATDDDVIGAARATALAGATVDVIVWGHVAEMTAGGPIAAHAPVMPTALGFVDDLDPDTIARFGFALQSADALGDAVDVLMTGGASGVSSGGGGTSEAVGTTAAATLYVETTGSDATGDGSVGAPFATIQAALDSLPKFLRHLVDIRIGLGNFVGFWVHGFVTDPAIPGNMCGLRIRGTLADATLSTGTASGTISAVATGAAVSDVTFSTVTDSTQSWTVDELKGLLLEIVTGTSATSILPIVSNTATTITVAATTAFGGAAGTYRVRDWGTAITTGAASGPSVVASNATNQSPTSATAGITVGPQMASDVISMLRIEEIKSAPTSATSSLLNHGCSAVVSRCRLSGGTSNVVNWFTGNGGGAAANFLTACTVVPSNGTTGILFQGTGSGRSLNCVIYPASGTPTNMISFSGSGGTNTVTACSVTGGGTGLSISGAGGQMTLASKFSSQVTGVAKTSATGRETTNLTGVVSVNSCTTGLAVAGPSFGTLAVGGSGNTTAISLSLGARLVITAASAVSGTVTVDGITTTLAEMRAATPKLIATAYGSWLAE